MSIRSKKSKVFSEKEKTKEENFTNIKDDLENDENENKNFFSKLFNKKINKKKKENLNMVPFKELFRFSTKFDKLMMIIGTICALAGGAMFPLVMVIFMNIIDSFSSYGKICNSTLSLNQTSFNSSDIYASLSDQMKSQSVYLVLLGIGSMIFNYFQLTFWMIPAERETRLIRKKLFASILKQDIGWFDVYKSGELNNRLADDVNKIKDGIGEKLGNCITFVSTFIVGILIGLVKGWKLTLVILSVSPLLFISSLLFTKLTGILTKNELNSYAKAGSVAEEVISSIRTVFAFNGSKKEHSRYEIRLDEARTVGIKKGFINGFLMGFLWLVIFWTYALGFWYGWTLSINIDPITGQPEYSIGKILLVFFVILIGVFNLGNAGPYIGQATEARTAAYEVFKIIDRVPPIDSSSDNGEKLDNLIGNIAFENVKFSYPSRKEIQILNGLNLAIKSGSTVALCGTSGCGKSTCIQLLQRFYDPDNGSIKIDNKDIKNLNVKWLRSILGVVNQEPILFGTTISENIKFGRDDATEQDIQNAAINANAHDFIMSLPEKYQTLVGDRGSQLSGGQKQRIAIARALVRNPKILLLDEATSALDNESESIVQAALDKARLGRTTLIIAHRLSTIRNADIIFAFDNGQIAEYGTHDDLMSKQGIYYNLVVAQQTKFQKERESLENENNSEIKEKKYLDKNYIKESKFENLVNENSKDEKKKEKKPSMSRVFLTNKPEFGYILIGCIASIIGGGVQPAFGVILSKATALFSLCSIDEQRTKITLYCILFVIFGIVIFVCNIIQSGMFGISGENLTKRLRSKAFESILKQEIGWFDLTENNVGVLTTKLSIEAAAVKGATGIRIGFIFMNLCNLGVGLIISFAFGWPITLLILAFIPFLILGGIVQTKLLAGFTGKDKKILEESGKITTEAISNIRTVVIQNKEKHFQNKYNTLIDKPKKESVRSAHLNGLMLGITNSVVFYAIAAAYTLGAYLIDQNLFGISLESILIVFNCIFFGAQSVGQAATILPDYAKAQAAALSIFNLVDRKTKINNWEPESNQKIDEKDFDGNIKLKQVEFTYPSRPEAKILNSLDLEVKKGQRIGLVGSSGCGKSTITQLIERYYDPDSGMVTLCDKNLKDLDLFWLRSKIGIVSQEPVLFDMTIRENIEYGDNSRTIELNEIIEAAKKANIHDFISKLPNAYETNVGSKGTQLSGGQKQRIAIARALIRDPKILLLDEATSALDTESEKIVQDALDKAQEGRTCFIIAHRLSTIRNADVIFVLKNGQVIEKGSHEELINLNGFYNKLYNQQ